MKTFATVDIDSIQDGSKKSWFLDRGMREFEVGKIEGNTAVLIDVPFDLRMESIKSIDIKKEVYIIVNGGNVVTVVGDKGIDITLIDWDNAKATEASFCEDEENFAPMLRTAIDELQVVEDCALARVDSGEFVEFIY